MPIAEPVLYIPAGCLYDVRGLKKRTSMCFDCPGLKGGLSGAAHRCHNNESVVCAEESFLSLIPAPQGGMQ